MSVILSLSHATAEWRAGLPPQCMATVRFLDGVSLTIARGECVVVRHDDRYSAQILLAALAGSPLALRAEGWRGERKMQTGLRIRRSAIRLDVLPWLLDGWRSSAGKPTYAPKGIPSLRAVAEPGASPPGPEGIARLHLLRASREGSVTLAEGRQWQRWARSEAGSAHAVVLVVSANARVSLQASHGASRPPVLCGAGAEPAVIVRQLQLHGGRLHG